MQYLYHEGQVGSASYWSMVMLHLEIHLRILFLQFLRRWAWWFRMFGRDARLFKPNSSPWMFCKGTWRLNTQSQSLPDLFVTGTRTTVFSITISPSWVSCLQSCLITLTGRVNGMPYLLAKLSVSYAESSWEFPGWKQLFVGRKISIYPTMFCIWLEDVSSICWYIPLTVGHNRKSFMGPCFPIYLLIMLKIVNNTKKSFFVKFITERNSRWMLPCFWHTQYNLLK